MGSGEVMVFVRWATILDGYADRPLLQIADYLCESAAFERRICLNASRYIHTFSPPHACFNAHTTRIFTQTPSYTPITDRAHSVDECSCAKSSISSQKNETETKQNQSSNNKQYLHCSPPLLQLASLSSIALLPLPPLLLPLLHFFLFSSMLVSTRSRSSLHHSLVLG